MCLKQTTFLVYIYSVAAVLYLQSVLHVMLFPLFNMFCTFTSALPAVCSAQYGSFLQLLHFALSRYVALSHFQTVPVAPIITGITFVFTVHMRSVSTVQSLYFRILSAPLFITFLPPFHHHTLRCPVYCYRQFCHFPLFIPQYGYRTVMTCFYQFRYMATLSNCALPYSTVQLTLYHVSLCTVLLPALDMPI